MSAVDACNGFDAQAMRARRIRLAKWLADASAEAEMFAAMARNAGESEIAQGFERAAAALRDAARSQGGES